MTGCAGRIQPGRPYGGEDVHLERPVSTGSRKRTVKALGAAVREASTTAGSGQRGAFLVHVRFHRTSLQEFAMADLAFVVTVLAGFALVALAAKGVTKL
ncbi:MULTISPECIES: hypothetical protein [unclassified Streptomyces]|uniref:hypothetical protein n=1 Tax=unclassified Streptomyces TaxID=2593676 RepID=UPI0033E01A73